MSTPSAPQGAPGEDLERLIDETLAADATPGIPGQITEGVTFPVRNVEPSPFEAPSQAEQSDAVANAESGEELPFDLGTTVAAGDDATGGDLMPAGEEADGMSQPIDDLSYAPEGGWDQWQGEPSLFSHGTGAPAEQLDDAIPLPEDASEFRPNADPFVFPEPVTFQHEEWQAAGATNVHVSYPDNQELADEVRERIGPMFSRVEESLSGATERAMMVESELLDRRNHY